MNTALAIGAHPDDIEFGMAGTLLMLKGACWDIHYLNVANGSCGSRQLPAEELVPMRRREAQAAARVLGAHWHPSLVNDLEVFYELKTLRRLAALLRDIRPAIVLTHSPEDYMEDHTNTCRLVVTAAFSRGMPNFRTVPPRPTAEFDIALYHAMPHGLQDGLRRRIQPDRFVNTTPVQDIKLKALACHISQQDWLDTSQGMNSYTASMDTLSRQVGRLSRRFTHAEGWRCHSHLGFATSDADPLAAALRPHIVETKARRHAPKPERQ